MKLNDIFVINDTLKDIIDTDKDSEIDPLFKFKLLGIIKNIEPLVENFNIVKNETIKKYGKENEDNTISIDIEDSENFTKYVNELNKILSSEEEMDINKLKAKDVFSAGIKSEYLIKLYPIIEE